MARSAGTRAPRALAYLALALADPEQPDAGLLAGSIAAESGLALPRRLNTLMHTRVKCTARLRSRLDREARFLLVDGMTLVAME